MGIGTKEFIKEKAVLDKRFWLKISNACNNKCVFCLDSDFKDNISFLPIHILKEKIKYAIEEGYTRLVISGGEATIHPNFIDIIKYSNEIGFNHIQTITNGRMFSYNSFAKKAVTAGLTETTFSIHGHNSEIHDKLTGIMGSFNQVIQGVKNLISTERCIVNIDIVINKLNIKFLSNIIDLFSKYGIYEYDLLNIVPFGRAYKNKDILICGKEELKKYLDELFLKYNKSKYFIWTNRLYPNILENNESMIQDPHKLYDEILGRSDQFEKYYKNGKLWCYSDRCTFCFIKDFCTKFLKTNDSLNNREKIQYIKIDILDNKSIEILNTLKNKIILIININIYKKIKELPVYVKEIILEIENDEDISEIFNYEVINEIRPITILIKNISKSFFQTILNTKYNWVIELNSNNNTIILDNLDSVNRAKNLQFKVPHYEILSDAKKEYNNILNVFNKLNNIPILNCSTCLNKNGFYSNEEMLNINLIENNNRINMKELTKEFIINDYFVKSLRCNKCKENQKCKGMHINFIRTFKFNVLKEIR